MKEKIFKTHTTLIILKDTSQSAEADSITSKATFRFIDSQATTSKNFLLTEQREKR